MQKAIDDSIQESDQTLTRQNFFISSKLWNNCHTNELVKPSIKNVLKNMSIDYLDLLYIHLPMTIQDTLMQNPLLKDEQGYLNFSETTIETYKEMEKCPELSNLGLANFHMVIKKFCVFIFNSIFKKYLLESNI